MRGPLAFGLALSILLGAAACRTPSANDVVGPGPELGVHTATTAPPRDDDLALLWARRDDGPSLAKVITRLEERLQTTPKDVDLLVQLARAEHFYATAHVALAGADHEDEELLHLDRGAAYADRALAVVQPEVAKLLEAGGDPKEALSKLEDRGVPAAFWSATNRAGASMLRGLTARLEAKDRVRITMETVLALRPDYFFGGADRMLGALYAVLPTIAGKDLDRSEAHFEASLRRAPGFLLTDVARAALLAVEREDRARFEQILNGVIAAPDGDDPDLAPENRSAKKIARRLLDRAPDLF